MVGSDYKLEWLGPFSDLYEKKHKGNDLELKKNVIRIYIFDHFFVLLFDTSFYEVAWILLSFTLTI